MAEVALTPARYQTLGQLAQRVRVLAGQRVMNLEPMHRKQLREIADDLDWFEEAYRRREGAL